MDKNHLHRCFLILELPKDIFEVPYIVDIFKLNNEYIVHRLPSNLIRRKIH